MKVLWKLICAALVAVMVMMAFGCAGVEVQRTNTGSQKIVVKESERPTFGEIVRDGLVTGVIAGVAGYALTGDADKAVRIGFGGAAVGGLLRLAGIPITRGGTYYRGGHPVVSSGYGVYSNSFTVKVFNGLSHEIALNLSAEDQIVLEPGGQADIPLTMSDYSRKIVLTAVVLEDGNAIGTTKKNVRIPSYKHRSSSETDWHITRYRKLG
jgi:hypothetical protein